VHRLIERPGCRSEGMKDFFFEKKQQETFAGFG
jgi:hypothetical protein